MKKIEINRLGPVDRCELDLTSDFTIFTGPQASGKSTVAKCVFFFRNIRNLLLAQFQKQCLNHGVTSDEVIKLSLKNRIEREIRSNFLQIFGTTWHMDSSMSLVCSYTEDVRIEVSLKKNDISPNYIWLEFSGCLTEFIQSLEAMIEDRAVSRLRGLLNDVRTKINVFFDDDAEIVYIPAGRSMITLLGTQLNYIYGLMDDAQKRTMDYCTQNYLERILRLKPEFSYSPAQMIQNTLLLTDTKVNRKLLLLASDLMSSILQGEYRYVDGEERLQLAGDRYVKINFASSGQQEVVWILNVIFYYLLQNKKAYFIIEEPESHLFPNAQKLITEFIALAKNDGRNQVFLTTHSPYILGTVNNLLYAGRISRFVDHDRLQEIIEHEKWLQFSEIAAYYIEHGCVTDCTDADFEAIENEVIDGASETINRDFEKMVSLKESARGGEEEIDAADSRPVTV